MIVFAYSYEHDAESKAEFEAFVRWSDKHAAAEVSAWRSRLSDGSRWFIAVVDETDGLALSFQWKGDLYALPQEMAVAFIERRLERILLGILDGERGRLTEKAHYGEAIAPRLGQDGIWKAQTPNVG